MAIPYMLIFMLGLGYSALQTGAAHAGTCTIIGGKKTPALMRIHAETLSADLGQLLWEGTLNKDQRVPIIHAGFRIRYMYRGSSGDTWSVHQGALCNNHEKLILP